MDTGQSLVAASCRRIHASLSGNNMLRIASLTALTACLALAPLSAQTVIDFDNLFDGNVVTNQYTGVTFSSSAGFVNFVTAQPQYNGSKPNFICTGPVNTGINCTAPTYIDFATAVSGVSIKGMGVNNVGVVAQVSVFDIGGLLGTVNVIGNAQGLDPLLVDLAAFSNVRRLEIFNITDAAGIGWDDLAFTSGTAVVPEPGTWAMMLVGLAGLAVQRRRSRGRA